MKQDPPSPGFFLKALDGIFCLLMAIFWSLPTLINQFPLVYYDSAFYLYNAFHLSDPAKISWRPLTYSGFIRLPLELFGFNFIIVFQNLIVAVFLLLFSRLVWPNIKRWQFCLVGLGLAFTPFLSVSNFIMPDIFTVLAIFAMLGFFYSHSQHRWLYLCFLLLFSAMHFANIIMVLPLLVFHFAKNHRKEILAVLVIGAFSLVLRFVLFYPQKSFEESAHYFVFSRFVSFDLVETYLQERCPDEELVFCKNPVGSFHIWGGSRSPSHWTPGLNILPSVVKLNQDIIKSHYFWTYFFKGLYQSARQLLKFDRPMEIINRDGVVMRVIGQNMGSDTLQDYVNPRFFSEEKLQSFNFYNSSATFYLLFSVLGFLILGWIIHYTLVSNLQLYCFFYLLSAYLIQALSIGFLSEPESRYSNRMIWGFAFLSLLYLLKYLFTDRKYLVLNVEENVLGSTIDSGSDHSVSSNQ